MTGKSLHDWCFCTMLILPVPCWPGTPQPDGGASLNVLLLKIHNTASAVPLLRSGKHLPRFKERGYVVRNSSVRCSTS